MRYRFVSALFARRAVMEAVALGFASTPARKRCGIASCFMRKFPDGRLFFFARCCPSRCGPKAPRLALEQSCAASIGEGINKAHHCS